MTINKYMQVMVVDTQSSLPTSADLGQIAFCVDTKLVLNFDGTSWTPSNRVVVKKSTVAINGMATGNTLIYTLENIPMNFYPTEVILRLVTLTGTLITQAVVSIGTNSTSYDNIAKGSLLTGVLAGISVGNGAPAMASFSPPLAANTGIYAKVTTSAIGPSVETFNVEVLGFYDS